MTLSTLFHTLGYALHYPDTATIVRGKRRVRDQLGGRPMAGYDRANKLSVLSTTMLKGIQCLG